MRRTRPELLCDDGLVHCTSENEAKRLLKDIKQRFETCGLTLHPDKTKIIYCKYPNRKGEYENAAFVFQIIHSGHGLAKQAMETRFFVVSPLR
ncbi:MAG: hypothetical protein ACJAYC_000646 [Halieaceae bacterium]|jgi:hypothetical protein